MDIYTILLDVVILLATALLLGMLFERFKQSAILGYLTAGALLGPGVLNLIGNRDVVSAMAELGVALLLFTIGLEFSWSRLRKLGPIALAGGTLQVVATGAAVGAIAMALQMKPAAAIALGAIVAPSSTACVLRMLADRAEMESVHGRNALGILLLQDIALVPLVLLVTMLGGEGSATQVMWGIGRSIAFAALLIAVFFLINKYVLAKLFDATATLKNRELPILVAVVTFLGATWAAHALSLSPALGAFVAGFLLAESPFATQVRADASGLRTLFVTMFFASIGMLAEPSFIGRHWPAVAMLVGAIVLGKPLIVWPIAWLFGNSHRHALATGICLAQVGEFSFLLAQIALSGGVIDSSLFRLIVSTTVATLFLTPYLVATAPVAAAATERRLAGLGLARAREGVAAEEAEKLTRHVIVVGLGPAGRAVMDALRQRKIVAAVVDLNSKTVALARQQGVYAEVGDATQEEVLEHLQVASARTVVVTIPDHRTALQIIRQVRSLAPKALIVVRSRYHIYARELSQAGAHTVVDEEEQIGRLLGIEVIRYTEGGAAPAREPVPPTL